MIKLIEADGGVQAAQRGSHRQFNHPTKAGRVTIAGKPSRDLSPGLERSMPQASRTEGVVMQYVIVIEPTPDGGWGAYAPDLPGVVALGDTPDECETEMRQALAFHLEGLREDHVVIPAPAARAIEVDVPAA